MLGYLPPSQGGDPLADEVGEGAGPDEFTRKLARFLHLEWCGRCSDWREQGHTDVDDSGKAGARAAIETEEEFPF